MTSFIEEVDYIDGSTRICGILGHPIEQVRSPENLTAELRRRALNAILIPVHVLPPQFDMTMAALKAMPNLAGLIFTIPFKGRAAEFADTLGPQATIVGAVNAMTRLEDGRWMADIFDGLGCVEAFRRRGISFAGKHVCVIGAGGAGAAIAIAVAHEAPASLRLHDIDSARVNALADKARQVAPNTNIIVAPPAIDGLDILINASPVGMLEDARLPVTETALPRELVVFDAIVKPETTPLLALAERCGCETVRGREMMRGQMTKLADFFEPAIRRPEQTRV